MSGIINFRKMNRTPSKASPPPAPTGIISPAAGLSENIIQNIKQLEKLRSLAEVEKNNLKEEVIRKVFEDVEEELGCLFCTEILIEPVTLRCGHNFCSSCICAWIEQGTGRCPLCRQKIRQLPVETNLGMNSFITKIHTLFSKEVQDERAKLLEERGETSRQFKEAQEAQQLAAVLAEIEAEEETLIESMHAIGRRKINAYKRFHSNTRTNRVQSAPAAPAPQNPSPQRNQNGIDSEMLDLFAELDRQNMEEAMGFPTAEELQEMESE